MAEPSADTPVRRGPYRTGLRRRQEIVRAAAQVFGSHGYRSGSLRAIGELVGATPASLAAYFGNKEGLLVAVLKHWQEEASRPLLGHSGLDYFRGLIELMQYHLRHRGLIELFLTMSVEASQPDHPARPFMVERQRDSLQGVEENLRIAAELAQILPISAADTAAEARLVVAVLDGAELQWTLDPRSDLVGLVRRQIDMSIARWSGRDVAEVAAETSRWLAN